MTDIVERLRRWQAFGWKDDPVHKEAADEIERLRAIVLDACEVLNHYGLPEHAFHYRRVLNGGVPLTVRTQLISATS